MPIRVVLDNTNTGMKPDYLLVLSEIGLDVLWKKEKVRSDN